MFRPLPLRVICRTFSFIRFMDFSAGFNRGGLETGG